MRKPARMIPVVFAVAVLAATVVARFATTNAHADVIAVLQGTVGPDFYIALKMPDGSVVSHLTNGDYEILVDDQATQHNFHLEGPGVSVATDIPTTSTADWFVSFGDGIFTYHCDQHAGLTASFAVGAASLPPPPAPVTAAPVTSSALVAVPSSTSSAKPLAAPKAKKVGGTVRAQLTGTKITLTLNGKPTTSLAAGTYKFSVVDTSKTLDLSLAQIGGNEQPLTTAPFTGTKTVTIDLSYGKWKIYSTAGKRVSKPFSVTS